jgi:serine/threonine protein kinase/WD40 repeat protein
MNDPGASPTPQDDALGPVVESFLDRFRRGERPALTELVNRHPGLADELRDLIPALVELEQLGDATGSFSGTAAAREPDGPLPERLGDYRILRRIGGGGMGVVYEAEHESLRSRVALKVMHSRFRTDRKYLRRFHIEARSAAGLHHTNIVSVFDYGEQDGVCFYAMQFIGGQPLDRVLADLRRLRSEGRDLCGSITPTKGGRKGSSESRASTALHSVAEALVTGRFASPTSPRLSGERTESYDASKLSELPLVADDSGDQESVEEQSSLGSGSLGGAAESRYYREVARVCAQVADALNYAHRRGVLHRDIKPPNLLLDALGNVWVTDFGLAKLEEAEDSTQSQELVGTLRYMAPDRFRGISDRSGDLYALGATLYEMLTLQPAFDGTDQLRLIDRIVHERPQPPRQIDPRVPRDLETIVLRALAKDPKDRFGSAGEMAEELRRFISGRPIHSRPVSIAERFWRWCKRDPWLAGASVAAVVLTAVLAAGSMSAAYLYRHQVAELRQEKKRTLDASLDARRRAVDAYIAQADAGRFSRRPGQRFSSLKAVDEASRLLAGLGAGDTEATSRVVLRDLAIAALALPDLRSAKSLGRSSGGTSVVDIDPAFERYVVSDHSGNCVMIRVSDGVELARLANQGKPARCWPRFGPDGQLLALHYEDGRLGFWRLDGAATALVAAEGAGVTRSMDFSSDGASVLVATSSGVLELIDARSGQRRALPQEKGHLSYVSLNPDGRSLVAVVEVSGKRVAKVRGLDDARPTASLDLSTTISHAVWSPDGSRIALAGNDNRIFVWEPGRRGATPLVLSGLNGMGLKVAFNHRGDLLASQGWEGMLRLWDPSTGRQLLSMQTDAIPRFSADDRYLGPGRVGGSLQIFEVASGRELRVLPGDASSDRIPQDLSFDPEGRVMTVRTMRGLQIWDSVGVKLLADLEELEWSAARFEADGTLLTFGSSGVLRWPVRREGPKRIVGPPRVVRILSAVGGNLDSSRDGGVLVFANPVRAAIVLSGGPFGQARMLLPQNDVRSVAVSPDGRWAATVSHEGDDTGVFVWDATTARRVAVLKAPMGSTMRFSPDGRWLATSSGECKLWEVGTWKLVREFDVDSRTIAFSPDTSALAICTAAQVRLYDPATGRRLATFENPGQGTVAYPMFSVDCARLAATDEQSHSILVWDLRLIRAELASIGLDWGAPAAKPGRPETLVPPTFPPPPIHIEVIGGNKDDLARIRSRFAAWAEIDRMRRLVAPRLDSPEEYHERSHHWAALGKWDAALADAERACRERKDDAHWIATVGLYAFQAGEDAKALSAMKRAVSLDPEDLQTAGTLAWALVVTAEKNRDPARALALADRLLKAHPGNREYCKTRALALSRLGRDADAVAAIGPSAALSPFDELVVAPCYDRLGQHKLARESLDRALVWRAFPGPLTPRQARDLDALIAEAEAVLAWPDNDQDHPR